MIELVTYLAALSVASERVVEILKNLLDFTRWFRNDKLKVASIHILASLVGTALAFIIGKDATIPVYFKTVYGYCIIGLLCGAGSSVWNSALKAIANMKPVAAIK